MKATKEQMDGELMVIKLFASNYARDLLIVCVKKNMQSVVGIQSKPSYPYNKAS
jgi:hypothetical protein